MSQRIQRVNQLIKREISQILLKDVEFPSGTLVTVTRVETSSDLKNSNIFISTLPEKEISRVLDFLNREIYELQQKINKLLKMRPVPRLKFIGEKETAEAGRIEEILEKLKKQEK